MYFVSLYCITYAPEGNPSLSYFLPRIKTTKNYNPFRGMFGNVLTDLSSAKGNICYHEMDTSKLKQLATFSFESLFQKL